MAVFFFFLCLLFFLSSFPHKTVSCKSCNEICPTTYYDGDGYLSPTVTVQFPFVVGAANQSNRCGYPGFNLTSDHQRTPIISLPFSGNFTVVQINYSTQMISISDPDRCLPNPILTLNLTGSPFSGADSQYYSFLNCTEGNPLARVRVRHAVAVPCLSAENFTVYVTTSSESAGKLSSESGRCRLIRSVFAPIMSFRSDILTHFDPGTSFMHLRWDVPDCRRCVDKYGWSACGFKSESGLRVGCTGRSTFLELLLAMAISASLLILIKACIICYHRISKKEEPQQEYQT